MEILCSKTSINQSTILLKNEKKNDLKNEIKNKSKSSVIIGNKLILPEINSKVMKSVCKIIIKTKKEILYGTGFFLNYSDSKKYLITNYHIINSNLEIENIEIQIYNNKIMKLKLNDRFSKYINKPKDIAIIELKISDKIFQDIEFLDYDVDYKKGYQIYKNVGIFLVEYPLGNEASCISGTIVDIDNYEFKHNISTDKDSSGCPIISLNSLKIIGIHKEAINEKINVGTFIGEILDKELKNSENNYINAEINIKFKDINKNIRIINSYEEYMRNLNYNVELKEKCKNENEIKLCKIQINDELISFNYFYKFKTKGIYKIKYSFMNNINNTCFMFSGCSSLISIDLSNFNSINVIDMSCFFSGCSSLTNIDFSNFNTNKVTNMRGMFSGCSSLISIDLSNFNTNNVIDMAWLFSECSSLVNIDLSNFNTNNVQDMIRMFNKCSSLTNVDLSNFSTINISDMGGIFSDCSSLTNIDLSNFNTNKVNNMSRMFSGCSSLINIDLSNFKTYNLCNMDGMFLRCSSLRKIDLSNFNTDKVYNMRILFCECSSLTSVNLSNFSTNKIVHMDHMFTGCYSLKKDNIDAKDKKIIDNYNISDV